MTLKRRKVQSKVLLIANKKCAYALSIGTALNDLG